MPSKSFEIFLSKDTERQDCSFLMGKFYKAFCDLDITVYIEGFIFQVEHINKKSYASYHIDEEKGLIVTLYPKLFSNISKIVNTKMFHINIKISYSNISDYKLLFPNMTNTLLLERISKFYEEADVTFENKAWMSYTLMAGAIFEGLLYDMIGENINFNNLIKKAYDLKYINENTKNIMEYTRNIRNLIHANKYNDNYVSRENVYSIKSVLDNILYSFELKREQKLKKG